MLRKILCGIILSLVTLTATSQTLRSFSEEPGEFIKELPRLFESVTTPGLSVEFMLLTDTLAGEWGRNAFNDEEKYEIIRVSNALLQKRIKPYPRFYNYFKVIMELHMRDKGHSYVLGYLHGIDLKLQEGSIRRLKAYLDQYSEFLFEKKLYGTNSFSWLYTDSTFLFEADPEPRFIFKQTDLICSTIKDTTVIFKTAGTYYPLSGRWEGFGGNMDWSRLGISKDTIFARLSAYDISFEEPGYVADSVTFFDRRFFSKGLSGTLEEKVLSSRPDRFSTYPRFSSYEKSLLLPDLFEGVNYKGGYTLKGSKLIGTGDRHENAIISIPVDEEKTIYLRSHGFAIDDEGFISDQSTFSISLKGDSLYHPGLAVSYNDVKRELLLTRSGEGISQSPFFNTFHDVNIYVEALHWDMSKRTMEFRSVLGIKRVSLADFISNDYFTEFDFDKLQGLDAKNPLFIIRNFCRDYKTNEISPAILASYMNKPPEQVEATLVRLSQQGFLYFDVASQVAIVEDKLFDYIDAKLKSADYDVIKIHSEIKDDDNAVLDLDNLDLLVKGVEEVFLSDSQNVYIYPRNKEIILKENRDFVFTGRVRAGLFDFFANECSFEYDSFRLNLPTVDSLSFKVRSFEENDKGEFPLKKVQTVIEGLSGTLLIDEPMNKSGLKPFKDYPRFISEQESFVYYDRDSIYDRETFKYHVAPFQIDSLDDFSTEGLEFAGYLESDNILPDIEQPLKVQPDYSLGFVKETPADGYPLYGGKGIFFTAIDLSNLGLRAEGTLKYLNSTTETNNLYLYPDSAVAFDLQRFEMEERRGPPQYPEASIDSAWSKWYPFSDSMVVYMERTPFEMFGGEADLYGYLILTDEDLTGAGNMVYDNARMTTNLFRFGRKTVDADTLDLRYFTNGSDSLAIVAQNYKGHLNLQTRKIDFRSNQEGSVIRFPYNDFICTMESIEWFLDRRELVLSSDYDDVSDADTLSREEMIEKPAGRSELISTNPDQDSLFFTVGFAKYNLTDYVINAEEVDIIRVADAAIFPYGGFVTIRKGGDLDLLQDATVVANMESKDHLVKQADVKIYSRSYYEGSGLYQYESVDGRIQEIALNEILVDSSGTSVGEGYIDEKEDFYLSPHFIFTGDVEMNADDSRLYFDGGFNIVQECYEPESNQYIWFRAPVDPMDVRIPVDYQLKSIDGQDMQASIFYSQLYDDVYPALFTGRKILSDTSLFSVFGWLSYDSDKGAFVIEQFDYASENEQPKKLVLDTRTCTIRGTGEISLPMEYGYVDLIGQGSIDYYIIPDSTQLNLALVIDFFFDEGALDIIADSISMSDLRGFDLSQKSYSDLLMRLLGPDRISEMQQDLGIFGSSRKVPDELQHTFVFTDLNMYWNPKTRSFLSKGPFGLAVVGETAVNRIVNGNVELVKKRSGDELNIYIEAGPRKWYFFNYKNGILQTTSSDLEYNAYISELNSRKRMTRRQGMEMEYEFTIADRRKRIEFLRKMDEYNP